MIIFGTGNAGAADARLLLIVLLRDKEESLLLPVVVVALRSSGSSSRLRPDMPVAMEEGESAVVCRLARLSVRAGAGERGMALSGGESGGGTAPYEKDISNVGTEGNSKTLICQKAKLCQNTNKKDKKKMQLQLQPISQDSNRQETWVLCFNLIVIFLKKRPFLNDLHASKADKA